MSRMEFITLTLNDREPTPSGMSWGRIVSNQNSNQSVPQVPQFYWDTGTPWHELNIWFLRQAELIFLNQRKTETLHAIGTSMKFYMKYLEDHDVEWWSFPEKLKDRCLTKFRGYLVGLRDSGALSPSTCKRRMGDVLRFYDWLMSEGVLNPVSEPYQKIQTKINYDDVVGFRRSLTVLRNTLSIPDRRAPGNGLEYGLEPLTPSQKESVLNQAIKHSSEELHLMLLLSFSTGMRLGSICDLKTTTLDNAVPVRGSDKLYWLHIGPKARGAAVVTKYSTTGRVIIPDVVLEKIKSYCGSARRLYRVAKATKDCREVVFLTKFGAPFSRKGKDSSSVVNTQIHRLKRDSMEDGVDLLDFKFHCARATFASEIAVLGLKYFGVRNIPAIIGLVRKLLMHKNEITSLAYISFAQEKELMDKWESDFYCSALIDVGLEDTK
ncbi:tyrosine-type recombinase/integrase [Pseudomonas sp. MOB-449]|nr:tyrosine-type recombinase/integrase [Pseudomonas sp. MOB-449]